MDETTEATAKQVAESLSSAKLGKDAAESLGRLARRMRALGDDSLAVGRVALEALLESVGFERGIVLAQEASASEPERLQLHSVASRARARDGSEWSDVGNAALAVPRSVVTRAFGSGSPIVLNDCLLEPRGGDDKAQHRTVICQELRFCEGVRGLLYLDRGLGQGDVLPYHLGLVESFLDRCGPILTLAFVRERLVRLEASVAAQPLAEESAVATGDETAVGAGDDETDAGVVELHGMVTRDPKMRKIFAMIDKVKDSDLNICIVGESGTGKELLARAVHTASNRRENRFVAENCGSIAESLLESELFGHVKGAFTGADEDRKGLFELANGGTLFLDEIGDMSEGMQRKLLRVLEEGEVRPIGAKRPIKIDVRVICASNKDLKELVRRKRFRTDLFYRLNVVSIELPPLREREGDVALLVGRFAREIAEQEGTRKRFSESAMKALREYPWPGNLRELRNVIRRVLLTAPGRLVARKDLTTLLRAAGISPYSGRNLERDEDRIILRLPARQSFNAIIAECERIVLENALRECGWNKSKVTKVLKIPRQSLYNKIAKYNLSRDWPGDAG